MKFLPLLYVGGGGGCYLNTSFQSIRCGRYRTFIIYTADKMKRNIHVSFMNKSNRQWVYCIDRLLRMTTCIKNSHWKIHCNETKVSPN